MRLIKKIFNKIIFASVVAIVFALFNRCEVKAYGYYQTSSSSFTSNGNIITHSDYNELFVNVAYGASSFKYGCENETPYWEQLVTNSSVYYANTPSWKYQCFYILQNKNNSNSYAWGANKLDDSGSESGRKPTNMFMYHVFPDDNTYNFVILQSYAGDANKTSNYMIYYENTPPELTKEGNNKYRLTATSKTYILHYRQGFNYDSNLGYNWSNYPWLYYLDLELNTNQYFETDHDVMKAPLQDLYNYGSNGVNNNFNYYATEKIEWNTKDSTADEFPSVEKPPSVKFTDNFVKVNGLYVAVDVLVNIENYDDTYKYYYQYTDIPDNYDENNFVELYKDNFLINDDIASTTLHFNSNGYLIIKIVKDGEDPIYKSEPINELDNKDPDITLNLNYNSSNNTIIDEILINTHYNIYKTDLTGYKCYYGFSATLLDDPQVSDLTKTDCKNGYLYVAKSNGYYYARIYYNDKIVSEIMKEVNEYGQLVSSIYGGGNDNIFGKLLGGTNNYLGIYTSNQGPLHSLVSLPLKLGTFIYQFFTLDNTCIPYDMGTIFNRHIVIGCVNLSILGKPLLHTIDIIFAGFFTITWGLFLYKLLRKIVILKDISVEGVFRGGIF